jgi:formamidase
MLKADPANIHWGYFSRDREPRLYITSGETVEVRVITSHGGVYPEGLMDDSIQRVYREVKDRGPGPHPLTGPIFIQGSEPGDALEVRILELQPRSPFGLTSSSPLGVLGSLSPGPPTGIVWAADVVTGNARALFRFEYPEPRPSPGEPMDVARQPALEGIAIPLRLHLGVAGVASDSPHRVSSLAPGPFGGNIDQWRFGAGTSMTYPVLVPGALFSCGDGHLAQGDGEVSSYGVEAHLNAILQFIVHKHRQINNPILETDHAWFVHGFGATVDQASREAAQEALQFLSARGIDREAAYILMSVATDMSITQLANHPQLGVHVEIRKSLFAGAA